MYIGRYMGRLGALRAWLASCTLLGRLFACGCSAVELATNGDFSQPLSGITESAATGDCRRVGIGGGGMQPFPSPTVANALQLAPWTTSIHGGTNRLSSRALLRSAYDGHAAGWYRVRYFLTVSGDYNGHGEPVTLDVVGANGVALLASHRVPLAPWRDEWTHYDEYVAANPRLDIVDGFTDAMFSALQITVAPGAAFTTGTLQLTGVSITGLVCVPSNGCLWGASKTHVCHLSGSTRCQPRADRW